MELGGLDLSDEKMWRLVHNHSIAALTFLVWDILITLDEEIAFIWTKLRFSLAKWLFLFARYFALAVALSNQLIMWYIATSYPNVAHLCKPWYAFQATVEQISGCVLDVILMIRIHALYDRNNRITMFLIALLAGQVLTMVFCAIFTVTSFNFNPVCLPVDTPRSYLPIAIQSLVTQVILLGLALFRYLNFARPSRTSLVTMMFQDSLFVFFTVVGLFVFLIVTILVHSDTDLVTHFWFMSVLGCAGCKVIMNMRHLSTNDGNDNLNGMTAAQFSTDFVGLSTDPDAFCMTSMTISRTGSYPGDAIHMDD